MSLPEYITKIEGHGVLKIHFKECRARLEVEEGERLFEAVLLGQDATRAPFITSRICGVCPTVHNITSIKAVENALGIEVDETTIELRKLLLSGQIVFSHLLHLFFLVLPDYYKLPSAIEIAEKAPAEYHIALNLKRISDRLLTVIGGRPIHPTTTTVGGFLKYPKKGELITLDDEIKAVLDEAADFIKIFDQISYPQIKQETEYLTLNNNNEYTIYDGPIVSSNGDKFEASNYKQEIKEQIKDYATAKFGSRNGHSVNTGALARIALMKEKLNPKAKKHSADFNPNALTHNPFNNIKAQAIELMHFLEEASKSIDNLLDNLPEKPPQINLPKLSKPTWGIAAIEAPRGTLYHAYEIDTNNKIINADIITPTVQNLTSIERDAETLLKDLKLDQKNQKVCIQELKMLIRAYDPCITCSVH